VIAVFFRVPMSVEGLRDALRGLGDVRAFPSPAGDPLRLLESLRPDAVIVDGERDASAALAYAHEARIPALYVPSESSTLHRVARHGWEAVEGDPSPELIRNILEAALQEVRV
jgi:hypothetical protein